MSVLLLELLYDNSLFLSYLSLGHFVFSLFAYFFYEELKL